MSNNILKEKKILFLIKTMDIGGAEKFTLNLCRFMSGKFKEVSVFSSGGIFEQELNEVNVKHFKSCYSLKKGIFNFFRLRKEVKKILTTEHFDIIHCQHRIFTALIKTINLGNTKTVYTANNYFDDVYQKLLFPDIAVAISPSIFRNLLKTTLFPLKKIKRINYGVNCNLSMESNSEFKNIGFIGRLIEEKGIFNLTRAVKILKEENIFVKLIFKGNGKDTGKLKTLIGELDLKEQIIITPPTVNDDFVFKDISVLVLPTTLNEGLPISVLEAMSKGIIVAATNAGSIGDAIINNDTGFIFKNNAPEEIANTLAGIIEKFSGMKGIRANAFNLISRNYSLARMNEMYLNLYASLLKNFYT